VAPFLMSSGSCLTTTCAAHIPLAASTAANATGPVTSVLMAPLVPRKCPVLKRDTAMVFHNLQSLTAAPARTLNVALDRKRRSRRVCSMSGSPEASESGYQRAICSHCGTSPAFA
jgi:hypothetical protein